MCLYIYGHFFLSREREQLACEAETIRREARALGNPNRSRKRAVIENGGPIEQSL